MRTKQRGVQDLTLALLYVMGERVFVCVFTVPMLSFYICYCAEPLSAGDILQSHPCHNPAAFSLHKFQGQSPKASQANTSCHIEIKATLKPGHCAMPQKAPQHTILAQISQQKLLLLRQPT